MLITTSRKPSQRSRTFCRGLERVLKARSINRGKMSLRDVFLKAKEMGTNRVMVVSERDGNPSGMEVYVDGELFAQLKFTVDFSLPQGRMNKDEICLRCEVDELEEISQIFDIPPEGEKSDYPEKLPDSVKQKLSDSMKQKLSDSMKQKIRYQEGKSGSKYPEGKPDCNILWIKPHPRKSTPVMEFFDAKGKPTGPRIFVYECKLREEVDESS